MLHSSGVTLSTLSSGIEIRITYVYYHLRNCTLFNGVHFSRIQNCRMKRNKLLAVRFKTYARVVTVKTRGRARPKKTLANPENSQKILGVFSAQGTFWPLSEPMTTSNHLLGANPNITCENCKAMNLCRLLSDR